MILLKLFSFISFRRMHWSSLFNFGLKKPSTHASFNVLPMLRPWNLQFKTQNSEHFIYKTEFVILENGKLVALLFSTYLQVYFTEILYPEFIQLDFLHCCISANFSILKVVYHDCPKRPNTLVLNLDSHLLNIRMIGVPNKILLFLV